MEKWEFPEKISSFNDYSKPQLEYTKMVCNHIFGLDSAFSQQTSRLKRNLLRCIHVKEFSEEVIRGVEPSLVMVIPNMVCDLCYKSHDIDICRDLILSNPETIDEHGMPVPAQWNCDICQNPFDMNKLERSLLEILNRRVVAYQM